MSVKSNLTRLRSRVERAAEKARRDPADIKLVAVTKTVEADLINEALDCGVDIIGENRVHNTAAKKPLVDSKVQWHMIGHLQSRKAREATDLFDMVQSVESLSTAGALQKRCAETRRFMPILIEINTSDEEQKFGLSPEGAESFVREVAAMPNLRIEGLMTMAAYAPDPEQARPSFRLLREVAERLKDINIEGVNLSELSMGMSNDFEVAIEEGSTMVRIGTAVFAK
jgi:hypothetical protein